MTSARNRLSSSELDRYNRNGFLVREHVFSADEVAAMVEAVERVCASVVARDDRTGEKIHVSSFSVFERFPGGNTVIKWEVADSGRLKGLEPLAHLDPVLTEMAEHPGLIAPMRDLVGLDDVSLFTEKLNLKRARGGGGFDAHRDFPYWEGPAEHPERLVTAWIALDDAGVDNGALEVLPGSHKLSNVPTKQSDRLFESFEIDEAQFDTSQMKVVPLAAGGVVFFGPFLVHGSAANGSERDRRALLYTYQPRGLRTQLDNTKQWMASEGAG
ncbi:MAG: phytanoyl-CoA dioxygenase family protein [Gammaproteobacteria bacterium]|jgi:phytanoyl-CoA hydroxylase